MIKTLITNVKQDGGEDRLYRFKSPYVLVYGRNGAGKSSVMHGLELACFGKVCDVVGKDIKLKRYIEYLSSEGSTVYSRIHTSENERLSYPKDAGDTGEEYLNAVQLALDAIKGSNVAFAKFLLKYLESDVELDVPIHGWDAVVTSSKNHREALLRVEESTSKRLRSHRAKLKELAIVAKYAGSSTTAAERLDAEEDVDKAKRHLKAIHREMFRFVTEAWGPLMEYMRRFLPDGMGDAELTGTDSDFTLGFENRPYPSGAETVALAVALAAAVLPAERSIYIFPDRAYDEYTLGRLMNAVRIVPAAGVFVQSTVMPSCYEAEKLGWQTLGV